MPSVCSSCCFSLCCMISVTACSHIIIWVRPSSKAALASAAVCCAAATAALCLRRLRLAHQRAAKHKRRGFNAEKISGKISAHFCLLHCSLDDWVIRNHLTYAGRGMHHGKAVATEQAAAAAVRELIARMHDALEQSIVFLSLKTARMKCVSIAR
jgi:hypothetical protein